MRVAVFAASFLSGVSSLVFQIVWIRLLHHVFGSTSVAISAVLTVFVTGLGLGAWLGGRYTGLLKRPLLAFGLAQGGVALSGLFIPWLTEAGGWTAAVLLLPTTLLGVTFPIVVRHLTPRDADIGAASARAGTLYALFAAGAALGAFLGGFVLLPQVGLTTTHYFAVGMSFVLAASLGLVGLRRATPAVSPEANRAARRMAERDAARRASRPSFGDGPALVPTATLEAAMSTPLLRAVVLAAFAVSGAATLCYEVVWSRALALVLGSPIHSFALALTTFLIGIALGSAYAARCFTSRPARFGAPIVALGLCALAHARVGLASGTLHFVALVVLCAAVILVLDLLLRRRLEPRQLTLVLFAVPLLGAVVQLFIGASDLPKIALAVIVLCSGVWLAPLWLLRRPLVLLGVLHLIVAVATFLSTVWQDDLPGTFAALTSSRGNLSDHAGSVQLFLFLTASLCLLPAALGLGAMFPLVLRLIAKDKGDVGRDVGTVVAANSFGAMLGASLSGFVLLPLVGMERTLHLGITLNLAVATGLVGIALWRSAELPRRAPLLAAFALLAVLVGSLYAATDATSPLRWDPSRMTLGAFRLARVQARSQLHNDPQSPAVVYHRDGLSATITVEKDGGYHTLRVNGKVDASEVPGGDLCTQIALAAYPMLLHARPPAELDVAVVGFGSGVTVGTALRLGAKKVDAIEAEAGVLEASRYFAKSNGLGYSDAKPYARARGLSIFMDDGRNHLAATRERYDLILSQASNPWVAGVADLLTTNHLDIAKRRLKKGGIYAQAVQLFEVSPENIKSIYRTFASRFQHVRVFAPAPFFDDTFLLGSDEPMPLDYGQLERRLRAPGVAAVLRATDTVAAGDLYARQLLGSREEVLTYTQIETQRRGKKVTIKNDTNNGAPPKADTTRAPVPLNTSDNARVELAAAHDLIGYERYAGYTSRLYEQEWPWGRHEEIGGIAPGDGAALAYAELALAFIGHLRVEEAIAFQEKSEELGDPKLAAVATVVLELMTAEDETDPSFNITSADGERPLSPEQIGVLQGLLDETEKAVQTRGGFGVVAARAAKHLLNKDDPLNAPPLRFLHAYLLYGSAETEDPPYEPAIEALLMVAVRDAAYADTKQPSVYYFLARAYQRVENFTEATRWMRKYVETAGALGMLSGGTKAPDEER